MVPEIRMFLVEVGHWKMPRARTSHEANVNRNNDSEIEEAFIHLAAGSGDRERIEACIELHGFGKGTGQTRMASAILRFLWPEDYGVIDWRNWAVLSDCDYQFLSRQTLNLLAPDRFILRQHYSMFHGSLIVRACYAH